VGRTAPEHQRRQQAESFVFDHGSVSGTDGER
jgi:hypothetical protein